MAPADTICVGVVRGTDTRDAPAAVLAALRAEVPGVQPLSVCDSRVGSAWKRLYLITAQRTADTLTFTGAVGRVTYRCRTSYSSTWPGTCSASHAS